MNKWNHYICDTCGLTTIARHDDEGVTPFIIGCYAKNETNKTTGARVRGCKGSAESTMFTGPQDDGQKPHVVFYRPAPIQAIEDINKEPERNRAWLLEHYQKGGSLMKELV